LEVLGIGEVAKCVVDAVQVRDAALLPDLYLSSADRVTIAAGIPHALVSLITSLTIGNTGAGKVCALQIFIAVRVLVALVPCIPSTCNIWRRLHYTVFWVRLGGKLRCAIGLHFVIVSGMKV
jgi:hypothetical protein